MGPRPVCKLTVLFAFVTRAGGPCYTLFVLRELVSDKPLDEIVEQINAALGWNIRTQASAPSQGQ